MNCTAVGLLQIPLPSADLYSFGLFQRDKNDRARITLLKLFVSFGLKALSAILCSTRPGFLCAMSDSQQIMHTKLRKFSVAKYLR